ncbi:hypothetical protein SAMN05192559_104399 [Halobacillus karajensis]|uniref:Uncharacterized protein n=1 Tax=Halobacillus karajensis TaxID=195088 RepID=A0A024P2H7_9BACI|nr:hypothetical protein BN982_01652 [Halobacillus karajensis]CDQ21822.1 hypothetical protein BN983_00016 [Halobacillus karajensis]CDQ27662.1 hypothetical protein BN981_01942 [Halobacillus karajensis]SEH83638.1 hypothetical protein SAMN05192559_104399 [Halobacillus karajensis]
MKTRKTVLIQVKMEISQVSPNQMINMRKNGGIRYGILKTS